MPKSFCQSCGLPTDYTLKKPENCSHCKSSFSAIVAKSYSRPAGKPIAFAKNESIAHFRADITEDDGSELGSGRQKLGMLMGEGDK